MQARTRIGLSIAVVLLAAGLLAWTGAERFRSAPAEQAGRATPGAFSSDVEARLSNLEKRLDELARIQALTLTATGRPSPKARSVSVDEILGVDDAAMAEQRDRTISQHEEAWRGARGPSAWSAETSALLTRKTEADELLASDAPLPTTRDIECRAAMCRMDFSFMNESEAELWADVYMANLGQSVGRIWSATIVAPDGTAHVRMYGFK